MSKLFSVVIPTHNRLSLLQDAVATVRRQEGATWELVVFDNGSTDPIGDYVRGLDDPRIRYERSDQFLPVTDSWNRALDHARGDYVILLGDDDGLTPGYFARLTPIIEQFGFPEVIYTALYQFMHPGVAPWDRSGYVADLKNGFFFVSQQKPFVLSEAAAREAVVGSLHLKRNFTFNIQAFLFAKPFLERLRSEGPVLRSPFPDYYIANVAFARSESTVIVPDPLAIAGVSKASFGYTLFNGLEDVGEALLNTDLFKDPVYCDLEPMLLPGAAYFTNYVITMEYVARAIKAKYDERVALDRYRRLQIFSALEARRLGLPTGKAWPAICKRLTLQERLWAQTVQLLLRAGSRARSVEKYLVSPVRNHVSAYRFQPTQRYCNHGDFSRAIEIYDALESGALS